MGRIEDRLEQLGIALPSAPAPPPGFAFSFSWARVRGDRAFLAGHGALSTEGAPLGPFGRVPSEVSLGQAQESARGAAIAMLGSLKRELGNLDRIDAWLMVWSAVNADPGYPETTNVANGFSDLILEIFGPDVGAHARMAVGATAIPLNYCFVAGAEVAISA